MSKKYPRSKEMISQMQDSTAAYVTWGGEQITSDAIKEMSGAVQEYTSIARGSEHSRARWNCGRKILEYVQ